MNLIGWKMICCCSSSTRYCYFNHIFRRSRLCVSCYSPQINYMHLIFTSKYRFYIIPLLICYRQLFDLPFDFQFLSFGNLFIEGLKFKFVISTVRTVVLGELPGLCHPGKRQEYALSKTTHDSSRTICLTSSTIIVFL